ncbi:MAG: hypothetical protein N3G21_12660 [Candidatus Hydrogenedentes bacterium]|nr:hypothetical protein [Candidatus Hydrogenedentota bacterium]
MDLHEYICYGERFGAVCVSREKVYLDDAVTNENEEINRFALRALTPEEYAVFSLDLCHNQLDRHYSKFPNDELEKINKLVPGRPLMERHDLRGSLPRGIFFTSSVVVEGDKISVRPKVYVLKLEENRSFIANIEGGVYRETSIGFTFAYPECSICRKDIRRCVHIPGRRYEGDVCFYWIRGVQEVLEGSVVACGSQGTGFVKEYKNSVVEGLGEKRILSPLQTRLTVGGWLEKE